MPWLGMWCPEEDEERATGLSPPPPEPPAGNCKSFQPNHSTMVPPSDSPQTPQSQSLAKVGEASQERLWTISMSFSWPYGDCHDNTASILQTWIYSFALVWLRIIRVRFPEPGSHSRARLWQQSPTFKGSSLKFKCKKENRQHSSEPRDLIHYKECQLANLLNKTLS